MFGIHRNEFDRETSAPTQAADMSMGMDCDPVNAAEALVLGTLQGARKLICPGGAELVVDPELNAYYFISTSLKPLASPLLQAADKWVPVYSRALAEIREASTAQPLERLRWFAGLIATPGVAARNLPQGQRYKLKNWPETEREYPRSFRIAKSMFGEARNLEAIAEAAGATLEEVTDYVNASFAADRLEVIAEANHGKGALLGNALRKAGMRLNVALLSS